MKMIIAFPKFFGMFFVSFFILFSSPPIEFPSSLSSRFTKPDSSLLFAPPTSDSSPDFAPTSSCSLSEVPQMFSLSSLVQKVKAPTLSFWGVICLKSLKPRESIPISSCLESLGAKIKFCPGVSDSLNIWEPWQSGWAPRQLTLLRWLKSLICDSMLSYFICPIIMLISPLIQVRSAGRLLSPSPSAPSLHFISSIQHNHFFMVSSMRDTTSPCFLLDMSFTIPGIEPWGSASEMYTTQQLFQSIAVTLKPPTKIIPRTAFFVSVIGQLQDSEVIQQVSPSLWAHTTATNSRWATGHGALYSDLSTVMGNCPALMVCTVQDCSSWGFSFLSESSRMRNQKTLSAGKLTLVSPLEASLPSCSILSMRQGFSLKASHLGLSMAVLSFWRVWLAMAVSCSSVGFSACIQQLTQLNIFLQLIF